MPTDRSIRNIPLPSNTRAPAYDEPLPSSRQGPPSRVPLPTKRKSRGWVWVVLVMLLCAVAGVLISVLFQSATITINPRTVAITDTQQLTALPNGPTGSLFYKTLTASQTATTSVAANGTQHVSRAATGVVTISNNYSTAPQALAANTRLITDAGTIYRIKTAVTVPGAKKATDGSLTPSSITVSVYADKPGESSNTTEAVALHIAGFKGDARYAKFLVQSQGPLSGGFIGDEPAIAAADLATAQDTLKKQLDQNIRSVATAQVPEGFLAVNGSLSITYTNISQAQGPNTAITLSQGVTATLAIVKADELAYVLAKQVVSDYQGESIHFKDVNALQVSLTTASPTNTGPLTLSIGGNPTLEWQVDSGALQKALLGSQKSDFLSILKTFSTTITCTDEKPCGADTRPFWRKTLPSDPNKLIIRLTK